MNARLLLAVLLAAGPWPAGAVDVGNDPGILMVQARIQIDAGQFEAALSTLSQVVQIDPRDADALNLLGFASRKTGALDRAARHYEAALAIDPDHSGALEYQGELFLMTGRPDAARANLERLARTCAPCEEHDDLARAIAEAEAGG